MWGPRAAYAVALVLVSLRFGVPLSKAAVLVWVLLGLLCFSLGDLRRWLVGVVFEWLPFAGILLVYDLIRSRADGLLATHVTPQLHADEWAFRAVPTVWLQSRLWDGPGRIHWYDYAVWAVYLTHFFVTLVAAAVVWVVAHHLFRRFVAMVSTLAVLGFTTYILFPAAPPWLAAREGYLPPTDRIVREVFSNARLFHLDRMFDRGSRVANDVAAIPSLHAAAALLVALYFLPLVPRVWRVPLALYPLAMAFALVYTGEHYVVDVVVGWVYACVAYGLVNAVADRRSAQLALEPVENRLEAKHAMDG